MSGIRGENFGQNQTNVRKKEEGDFKLFQSSFIKAAQYIDKSKC